MIFTLPKKHPIIVLMNNTRERNTKNTKEHNTKNKNSHKVKDRQEQVTKFMIVGVLILVLVAVGIIFLKYVYQPTNKRGQTTAYDIGNPTKQIPMPELDVQLLTINEYSRAGMASDEIKSIVVHYTANPGSTAQNNRDYFENLKDTRLTKASSNFIVGLDGEIIQCVPTAEVAYASNERNHDSVSIETCHPDETGAFNQETYDSLVELVAFLCGKFNLTTEDIIRHYDITEKNCPKYFVENEDSWLTFKEDVARFIAENGE